MRRLLRHGLLLDERGGHMGSSVLMQALDVNPEMMRWLLAQGIPLDTLDDAGNNVLDEALQRSSRLDVLEVLLQAGLRPTPDGAASVITLEAARLLLNYGLELQQLHFDVRSRLLHCRTDQRPSVDEKTFRQGRDRRFGRSNPERHTEPFWLDMVDSRAPAYRARDLYAAEDHDGPIWCYERFGCSVNALPDGRVVEIGGEHEDFYDSDFCIYNDVLVHDGQGGRVLYGYPADVFVPTDFHSATWSDGYLYVIGGLGYPGQRRVNLTSVYRLDCDTFQMERVHTQGRGPGWIYGHQVRLLEPDLLEITGGMTLLEGPDHWQENRQAFLLDLKDSCWYPAGASAGN
ncbi:MAG: hypothetical protein GAK43_02706 [Stenotrophomonas maltophilia]|nr:MAG: hypothetical protein GAK43_02706 [Stenotrophomonas maltophilia]